MSHEPCFLSRHAARGTLHAFWSIDGVEGPKRIWHVWAVRDHRKLRAWQSAQDFVVAVYQSTSQFPRDERFGLTQQLRRASVSIASNIAEGCGRDSVRDLAHFLSIARASASECESQIITARRLGFINDREASRLVDHVDHIRRQIHNYRRAVISESDRREA